MIKTVKLSEIKIPYAFSKTTPKPEKVQKFKEEYEQTHDFAKKIRLNKENFLTDGYARYIALKELGVEECEVRVPTSSRIEQKRFLDAFDILNTPMKTYKEKETTYIYGFHPNNHNDNKEYVWRVLDSKKFAEFKQKVQPGDTVFVNTVFGVSPLVVTKVCTEIRPDLKGRIKTVAKTKIIKGGEHNAD